MTSVSLQKSECFTCKVRSCSILDTCGNETLAAVSNYKLSKSIRKGEKLFSEGDPIRGVCFIKKGYVKIELNGKQGRPLILKIAGRGAILGYRINSKHTYYSFSATAASDVQYCYIPNESFNVILQKCTDLKLQIINQLLDDLEIAEKKAIYLAHKTVREKIAEALLLLAEAYQYEIKRQSFKINLCRQDIADLAGTTKEQVSKTLKEFEKEKLIKCSAKKFSYINIQLLKEVVGNTYAPHSI